MVLEIIRSQEEKHAFLMKNVNYNWNQERGSLSVRIPRMPAARLFELEVVQS